MFQMNVSLAYARQDISEELPRREEAESPAPGQQEESDLELYRSIRRRIEQDELYKDPNFSLSDFSQLTRRSSRRISTVINHVGKTNFPSLVNEFRINEARRLLAEHGTSMPKADIATATGFSNSISFNRRFKDLTVFTPTDYLNMLQQEGVPESDAAED
jgi:AraC-like DNA-binding protein